MLKNPYLILGVEKTTSDELIRKAYLSAIRQCPPEKDAIMFQSIQTAYEKIKTQRLRLAYDLFNSQMPSAADLLAHVAMKMEKSPQRPTAAMIRALLR